MTREELNAKYPWMKDTELFQHANGGGWVQHPDRVDKTAYIEGLVSGDARVYGDALVSGDAQVYGDALVYGDAQVFGNARVYGDAQVYGNARVFGNAQVYGNARVFGNALVGRTPWTICLGRHTITKADNDVISIGCHVNTLAGWLEKYEAVGRMEGYTPEEVARYGAALKMIEQLTTKP